MPIYVYLCSSCATRSEIRHGIEEGPPEACPSCDATGTLRKSFAAPAIVFKGSGWAKKERRIAPASAASGESKDGESRHGEAKAAPGDASGDASASASGSSGETPAAVKPEKGSTGGDRSGQPKAAGPSSTPGGTSRSSGSDAD
jgi:putative FmdB family regulatory protein